MDDPLRRGIETADLPALVERYYPDSGARSGRQDVVHAVWRGDHHASFSLFIGRDGVWLYRDHATGENGNAYTFLTNVAGLSPGEAAALLTVEQASSCQASRQSRSGVPQPKELPPRAEALWRAIQQGRVQPFVHPLSRCTLSIASSVACLQAALEHPQGRDNARIIKAAYAALTRNGKKRRAARYGEIVETYDYEDEKGEPLFQVVRFEPKGFAQRRQHPSGEGWIWGLGAGGYTKSKNGDWVATDELQADSVFPGTRQVLYHLPRLLEGIDAGRGVLVPEGERDVHRLEGLGFVATTNPGGALKWCPGEQEDYSEALRGARVYLLPDNDPAGREHASRIENALIGIAAEVFVVVLPGLAPKGDVTDWLDSGRSRDELIAQLTAAHRAYSSHWFDWTLRHHSGLLLRAKVTPLPGL